MKLACTSFALHYSTGIASVDARKPVSIALHRALSKYLEKKKKKMRYIEGKQNDRASLSLVTKVASREGNEPRESANGFSSRSRTLSWN